jgi:hypothetical protein
VDRDRYRLSGVVAVAIVWCTLLLGARSAHLDLVGPRPLSDLARHASSFLLFDAGVAVAAVLFMVFQGYLRRRYPVGLSFSVVMLVGMTGQLVAAFVPLGGAGPANDVHVWSALVLGAALPLLMWRFAAAQPAGPWRRLCWQLFAAELAACVVGYALSVRHLAPLAEIVAGLWFHVWVIATTFVGPDRPASGGRRGLQRDGEAVPGVDGGDGPHQVAELVG